MSLWNLLSPAIYLLIVSSSIDMYTKKYKPDFYAGIICCVIVTVVLNWEKI